jgi:hypothetical protein
VDGLSHKKTRAYCCYGVNYDAAKTGKQRATQIVTKFSNDLLRLFELERNKKKLVQAINTTLEQVVGAVPDNADRITHITLITNWFESNTILGPIHQHVKACVSESRCRWVSENVDVVIRGPKEFAAQYGVEESTMLYLKHGDLFERIERQAPFISVPEGPTFDSKMQAAETMLPDATAELREVAADLRRDWQRAIAFERDISDRVPGQRKALERARRQLRTRVLIEQPEDPWGAIGRGQQIGEQIFAESFSEYGGGFVRDLASGEVARLVGICPINWKAPTKPHG